MAGWSFLTNYGLVLSCIGRFPDSTGLEIAQAVGITERSARKIIAELQGAGYIEQEKLGRRNRYRINTSLPLRLLGDRAITVGALLDLLWRDELSAENEGSVPASQSGSGVLPSGPASQDGAGQSTA